MFIGHIGLGFAVKRVAPEVKLWEALLAATFLDVVYFVLLILGIETVGIEPVQAPFMSLHFDSYPWSHSLAMALVWGVTFALIYRWRGGTVRGSVWLVLLVTSHWVLDFLSHGQDMTLFPGGRSKLGLGLIYSAPGMIAAEMGLFALGTWLYVSVTRARDRQGMLALGILLVFLLTAYVSSVFGPPPPSAPIIAVSGLTLAAVVTALAVWVDMHRLPTQSMVPRKGLEPSRP